MTLPLMPSFTARQILGGMSMPQPFNRAGHNSGNLFARLGAIEYRNARDLKPHSRKLRKRTPKQLGQLMASIDEFGFLAPVLVTPDGEIVAGEARVEAAKQTGLDVVPTICVEHLSPAQIQAYRLIDNRLGELAEWDLEALREEVTAIIDLGEVDIALLGWETGEIDVLLGDAGTSLPGADQNDPADEMPEPAALVSQSRDLWTFAGGHRLLCGSSRDPDAWDRLARARDAAVPTDAIITEVRLRPC